ncbi:hypothetical protein TWF730_002658 [Orbilia blumenaviensis]|uniref:DUF6589 domain-containing protein n=1 Tax=Orbilia blumenaviensis TaxID=1796055 RepID=A0AAV9UC32_9PEZI
MVPSEAAWEYARQAIRYYILSIMEYTLGIKLTKEERLKFKIAPQFTFQCPSDPPIIRNFGLLPFNQGEMKVNRAFLEYAQEKEMSLPPGSLFRKTIPFSADQLGLLRTQTNGIQADVNGIKATVEDPEGEDDDDPTDPVSLSFATAKLGHASPRKDLHNQERFIEMALDAHVLALLASEAREKDPADIDFPEGPARLQTILKLVDQVTEKVFFIANTRCLQSMSNSRRDYTQEGGLLLILRGLKIRDLCRSVRLDDTGRLMKLVELVLFIPFFAGSGMTNYMYEFLSFKAAFTIEYSQELLSVLKSSWLINPSGKPGSFWRSMS